MSKTNKTLLTVIAAGVLLLVSQFYDYAIDSIPTANAETVTTTRKTRVMARPGEKSRIVTRLAVGKKLTVLARKGRWIKVRANGRTGWITRTSARSDRAARGDVRKTRRRAFVEGRSSKRRGWSGSAPSDRVGADATAEEDDDIDEDIIDEDEPEPKRVVKRRKARKPVKRKKAKRVARRRSARAADIDEDDDIDEEDEDESERTVIVSVEETELHSKPSRRSRGVAFVEEGQELTVIRENDSGWILVEDEDGEAGWIRTKEVNSAGYVYPKMEKLVTATLGYTTLGSVFVSDGVGELANYKIASAAASLSIGGEVLYKHSDQYMISADFRYTGTRASPGIRFVNAAGDAADIAFVQHEIHAVAGLGYNMKNDNGMVVYGRAGYYYGKLDIKDVGDFTKNLAYLPSEILQGLTVGARVDVPRLTDKIGVRLGVDALYPSGKRTQTQGLEDGAVSKVFAAWAMGHLTYQWKLDMTIEVIYRYSYAKTDWQGAADGSMRPHNATVAARKDVAHTGMIGVGKKF